MNLKILIFLSALLSVSLNAEETEISKGDNVGYSCFQEPTWPNEKKISYLCVFELNTVSPFYSEDKRAQVLKGFIRSLNSACKISEQKEMTDSKNSVEHTIFLIVYQVKCN